MSIARMTEQQKEQFRSKWLKLQAKGKARFVLFHGVVRQGMAIALLQLIVREVLHAALNGTSLLQGLLHLFTTERGLVKIAVYVALFSLIGYFWGWYLWWHNEKLYEQLNATEVV